MKNKNKPLKSMIFAVIVLTAIVVGPWGYGAAVFLLALYIFTNPQSLKSIADALMAHRYGILSYKAGFKDEWAKKREIAF